MTRVLKIFSLFLLFLCKIHAQEASNKEFLFNSEAVQLQTFFAEFTPQTQFTKLNGQNVNVGILNLGFILNDKFTVSFFIASSPKKVNLIEVPEYGSDKYYDWIDAGVELDKISSTAEFLFVNFKHSGIKLGYLHNTNKTVFYRAGLSIGFLGGLTFSENSSFLGIFNNIVYKESVLSVEPEIGVGVNLLSWWRVSVDVGYRLLNADTRIMSAADSDGYTLGLTFAFGNFK